MRVIRKNWKLLLREEIYCCTTMKQASGLVPVLELNLFDELPHESRYPLLKPYPANFSEHDAPS